jgi:guanylate kinase
MNQYQESGADRAIARKNLGNLIVITGPSGVGKGTVVQRLLESVPKLTKSVSVTTRKMRAREAEGIDYFFVTKSEFEAMVKADKFLEWAEFAGSQYGTPRNWVEHELRQGRDVILEIEVQGAKQIRNKFPNAVLIFLSPPSLDALASRLRGRKTESAPMVQLRLAKARQELREKNERGFFHYEVVNDNIEDAVTNLLYIVYAERCRIRDSDPTGPQNEHNQNP